jgi:hypothetical protein
MLENLFKTRKMRIILNFSEILKLNKIKTEIKCELVNFDSNVKEKIKIETSKLKQKLVSENYFFLKV